MKGNFRIEFIYGDVCTVNFYRIHGTPALQHNGEDVGHGSTFKPEVVSDEEGGYYVFFTTTLPENAYLFAHFPAILDMDTRLYSTRAADVPDFAEIDGKKYMNLNAYNCLTPNADGTTTVMIPNAKTGEHSFVLYENGVFGEPLTFTAYIPTDVSTIEAVEGGEAVYFNLQGRRVANPEKGMYIRVVNGKAVKVVK